MSGPREQPERQGRRRGFARASQLIADPVRVAGEARGFAVSRLLTHWDEIVGPDLARVARPVGVSYGRQGLGATLTLIVPGPEAQRVEMQKERLCERVNACYGYRAIARVRITQTAPQGFAEAQAAFGLAPPEAAADPPGLRPEVAARAQEAAEGVENDELRLALAALAANVLSRNS
jgi:hypothetical protein